MTRFAIGVDLGGTNLRVAAVNENGGLFDHLSLETLVERGREDVVNRLTSGILELVNRWKDRYQLAGIGIGIPGIIRMKDGILVASPNLPGWENFNVRAQIAKRLNSPFFLENDANAAALGEKWIGAGGFESVEQACTQSIQLTNQTHPIAANVKRYAEYYQVYRSLYGALKPSFDTVTRLAAAG